MRHASFAALALGLGALISSAGLAPRAAIAAPGDVKVDGKRITTTGTVTAVDLAQRMVTVKGERGVERAFRVDPGVDKLENVKVGDRVRVDYLLAVAVSLLKNGNGIREKVEEQAQSQAPVDGMPQVAAGKRTTLVADVISVNRTRQTVRLKGAQGRVADFKVKDKAALADVKPGDQVVAVVDEALAVRVMPAAAPASASAAR